MNTNMQGDFHICINVPLKFLLKPDPLHFLFAHRKVINKTGSSNLVGKDKDTKEFSKVKTFPFDLRIKKEPERWDVHLIL